MPAISQRAERLFRRLPPGRRAPLVVVGVTALLVIVAAVVLVAGLRTGHRHTALPPTPPSPASRSAPAAASSTGSRTGAPTVHPSTRPITCRRPSRNAEAGSDPDRICIPTIGVDASVMQLGLNRDRTVQVPPLSRVGDAGWYRYSATAGGMGPTVILGHVDSAQYGAGVFFRLGQLRAGDQVRVDRADGRVATFRIDRVVEVSKTRFPTQDVYGPTSGPALRLVTCGGRFDAASGSYEDNIIAFGSMESLAAQ